MFCTKCGKEISAESKFCHGCGKPTTSGSEQPESTPVMHQSSAKPIHEGRKLSEGEFLLLVESKKKSGWIAALLNLAIPGGGYVYCGRWLLGIAAFILVVAIYVSTLGFAAYGLVVILVIDGFLSANKYNRTLVETLIKERDTGYRAVS